MDEGEGPIHHSAELAIVQRQARRVHVQALLAGVTLTALSVALAGLI